MVSIIHKNFPDLTSAQKSQFAKLGPIYKDWNSRINVISRKDIDNFYLHHVLHSLVIAKVINFLPGADIIDIGTGGGFHGVPLAIMFPKTNFLLVDSVGKKLKVVEAVAKELELKNIKIQHARVEDLNQQFDFALARAVTNLDTAWSWVKGLIKKESRHNLLNGLFYLKGGDISKELPIGANIKTWHINEFFDQDYFNQKDIHLVYKK